MAEARKIPPRGPMRGMGQHPTNIKGVMPKILKLLFKNYGVAMVVILICLVIAAVAGITGPMFLQRITDEVIEPTLKGEISMDLWQSKLLSLIMSMIAIYSVCLIATTLQTQILARVGQRFLNKIRKQLFNKMQSLPIKYFDSNPHGEIMSYYTNDVDAIRQFVTQSLIQFISTFLSLTFTICLMIHYSVWLTLLVFVGASLMILVTKKVGGNSAKYFIQNQKTTADVEGYIEEMMHGQKVVKVFCYEDESKARFDKLNDELCLAATNANHYGNTLMPIMHNIGNIFFVLLAIIGCFLAINNVPNLGVFFKNDEGKLVIAGMNTLTIGIIVAFLNMSRQFSQSVGQVSQQVSMVAMALAGAKRVFDFLDEKEEEDSGYVTLVYANKDQDGTITESPTRTGLWAWKHPHSDGTITYTQLKGDIVLNEVDFGYVPEKIVLHDVSIYARPGQKIAFVGATGAGKTTITNLINRFYDIQDGKIRYDGININKIKKDDLRRSLGIVLQDTNLFTGTVMENIRYGRLDATDEEVYKAAKIANAYDFITRLPEGFNTMLTGDGANLSQGQRQLLSIARAAIADAPVMILDEATSSIDTRTEALVQRGTDQLMKGRTVFVIAHRLSTVQNSDAIMVLDHGRIIERGSHESLIEQKGTYYQLYTGAFELE